MFDVSLLGAALAGLMSFLSPCILPLVPFYLSYLAGGSAQAAGAGPVPAGLRVRAVLGALAFAAGVVTVFVALGATATLAGALVREWLDVLRWLAAAVVAAMGLHFLGAVRIAPLDRQFRLDGAGGGATSLGGAYVIGLAFAFGWTPCVGPVLAAILFMAGAAESAGRGMALLLAYGAGMTLPFVLAALFVGPFTAFAARFRRHLPLLERATGVLLLVFAALIATDGMSVIAFWMLETFPVFGRIG